MPGIALTDLRAGVALLSSDPAQPPVMIVTSLAGSHPPQPYGITRLCDGRLAFADRANHRIVAVGVDGGNFESFGSLGSDAGRLRFPSGVATDSTGRIYVADTGNCRVVAVDSMAGDGWQSYGTKGGPTEGDPLAVGRFAEPVALVASAAGLAVADPGAARVVRLSAFDDASWQATAPGTLRGPAAVAWLPNGTLVVADLIARQIVFLSTRSLEVTGAITDPILHGPTGVVATSDDQLLVCVAPLGALLVVDRSDAAWSVTSHRSLDKLGLRRPTSLCLLP
jgi:DNA-binding beta-propeller fold protein YncE